MVVIAEQAGAELAIGGQPDAGAMAAKGLGHRGDQADFTRCAIGKAVFASGFAVLVGDLFERPAGVYTLVNFRGRNNQAACPVALGIEEHKITKAVDDAGFEGMISKGLDFVVVDAPNKNSVDFGGG